MRPLAGRGRLALLLIGLFFVATAAMTAGWPLLATASAGTGNRSAMAAAASSLLAPPSSPITCRKLTARPVIDGQSNDWAGITGIYMDAGTAQYLGGTVSSPTDNSATLRCLWDTENLYLLVDVTDDMLIADSSTIWDDDSVEIALDGKRDRSCCDVDDAQVTIAVDRRIASFGSVDVGLPVTAAVALRAGGYTVEASIPFTMFLPTAPVSGTLIGFSWGLNDDDDGGRRDAHMLWAGSTILNYPQFGDIVLAGLPAPAATPTQPTSPLTATPSTTATAQPSPTSTTTPTVPPTATPGAAATATWTPAATATPGPADRLGNLETGIGRLGDTVREMWTIMQQAGYLPGDVPPPATPTPTPTATPPVAGYRQRVNCGGPAYSDSAGQTWAADQPYAGGSWGYVGGLASTTTNAIGGTTDAPLYQSERYNMLSYRFDVPPGRYAVELRFAEIYQYAGPGLRVFDVQLEGSTVITGLDLYTLVGPYVAYTRTFEVPVVDGQLNIDFVARRGAAKVSAIQVTGLAAVGPTPTPSLEQRVGDVENAMTELEKLFQRILATFDRFLSQ